MCDVSDEGDVSELQEAREKAMRFYDAVHCSMMFGSNNTYDPDGQCTEDEGCKCDCPYCSAWWEEYARDQADEERGRGMDKEDH